MNTSLASILKSSNIRIVYEDDWLVIVDKPAGLLVIPTPKNERRTLTSILNAGLEKKGESYRLHPCHRLDRETSGLIIYAKGKAMQKKMMQEFKDKKIKKTYIAFVQGRLHSRQGEINSPIDAEAAITKYKVIEERRNFSVIQVSPLTGRTNQIRIHFKRINHPIVGETKFAFRKDFKLKAKRLCLHAKELEFTHPMTGRPVYVRALLALDMEHFKENHPD